MAEAARRLAEEGLAAAPCTRPEDVAADPHVVQHHMVVEVPRTDGVDQPVLVGGNPVKLSRMHEGPDRAVPLLGEHTGRGPGRAARRRRRRPSPGGGRRRRAGRRTGRRGRWTTRGPGADDRPAAAGSRPTRRSASWPPATPWPSTPATSTPWSALFVPDVRVGRGATGRDALRASFDALAAGHRRLGADRRDPRDRPGRRRPTPPATVYCRGEIQDGDRWIHQAIVYDDEYRRDDGAWYFVRRVHRLFYGAEVGVNPLGLPPADWPEHHDGRGTLPGEWATWTAFWGPGAPPPGA